MNNSQINKKWVLVLGSVATALLIVALAEWLLGSRAREQILNSRLPLEHDVAADNMPKLDLAQRSEDSFDDLVSRPLFIEGRKPVPEPVAEQIQTPVAAIKFDWLLNGIYSSSREGAKAMFSRASRLPKGGNHKNLKQGELLDGFTLVEIQKDRVILSQNGTQKELLLQKPKPKQLQPNRNAPPQPPQQQPTMPNVDGNMPGMPEAWEQNGQPPADGAMGETMPIGDPGQQPQAPPPQPEPEPEIEPQIDSPDNVFETNDNENF